MRARFFSFRCSAAALLLLQASLACAGSDRPPVVLDTQTGIHDGRSGIVLQNAPLSRQPMVAAPAAATLPEYAAPAQPPIIVSPYIDMGGAASAPRAVYRPRTNGQ